MLSIFETAFFYFQIFFNKMNGNSASRDNFFIFIGTTLIMTLLEL